MRRILVASFIITLLSAGCARSSTLARLSPPGSGAPATDQYQHIIAEPSDRLNISTKYQCGGFSVTPPDFETFKARDLILMPTGKLVFRITTQSVLQYDATFSSDCSHLYWINSIERSNGAYVNRIHSFDLISGKTAVLIIPASAIPTDITMQTGSQTYYPALTFLYAIDPDHLLLSFQNPTTGTDAFTNQSSQAIFNIQTGHLLFVSEGGGSPPVLLDFKNNLLIVPGPLDSEGLVATRVVIDLRTSNQTSQSLSARYRYTTPCDPNAFSVQQKYQACREQWLGRLLK
jgi:hypothetical protein